MATMEPGHRRWLARFAATLAILIAAALYLYVRAPGMRDPPFDFYALQPGELYSVRGLTRRQEGSVKLGFAETFPPPEIGAYGNHVIMFFGAEAFGRPDDAAYFFNYYFANLSLPEIYRYLSHVEKRGRLPKKLLLVQVTTPNNDNGQYIINWGYELPPDVLLSEAARDEIAARTWRFGPVAWHLFTGELQAVLNYNTFILSIVQGGHRGRVVGPARCTAEPPAWLLRLPDLLLGFVGASAGHDFYCLRRNWRGGYRRDGSIDEALLEDPPPVRDENPLHDGDRAINAGDEREIARYMRSIDALGRRHGLKVVFIVPPVYESDRRDSVVNQVFDRALALAPDIAVIDHRGLGGDATLFKTYNHPLPKYYRIVVDELRRRGLID